MADLPKTLIIWHNPGSTNSHRGYALRHALQKELLIPEIQFYETTPHGRLDNKEKLQRLLADHPSDTWLVVAGGDGTIGSTVNAIYDLPHRPPILPLAAGNSNDIATILHGRRKRTFKARALRHAHHVSIRPVICELTDIAGHKQTHVAVTYVSFGLTAHTAGKINAPSHRAQHTARTSGRLQRRIHEIRTFMDVLDHTSPFTIEENGKEMTLYERLIVNGQRMARYFRWPVALTEDAFHDIRIDSLDPKSNMRTISKMASGRLAGEALTRGEHITFIAKSRIAGQSDGETFTVEPETKVDIYLGEKPLQFISLR